MFSATTRLHRKVLEAAQITNRPEGSRASSVRDLADLSRRARDHPIDGRGDRVGSLSRTASARDEAVPKASAPSVVEVSHETGSRFRRQLHILNWTSSDPHITLTAGSDIEHRPALWIRQSQLASRAPRSGGSQRWRHQRLGPKLLAQSAAPESVTGHGPPEEGSQLTSMRGES